MIHMKYHVLFILKNTKMSVRAFSPEIHPESFQGGH